MRAEIDFEGPVTILFTDVEGSTELRTRRGDEGSHSVLKAHEDLIRAKVREHGGREVKALGDGLMIAFASARRAIGCALDMQKAVDEHGYERPAERVRLRIGINTGEVITEDGDLFGEAVNAAARIADKAKGGQILASSVVKELAGTVRGVRFHDIGSFKLKGFPERRRLYEVVREDERTTIDRTPFVGRESERAELLRLLDKAIAGEGSVALIGGEPGVGKTRLAEEVAAEGRRRGAFTLIGRCYDTETAPPYLPFVDILETAARGAARSDALRAALGDVAGEIARIVPELRRIFPDIPPPLELPQEQERRFLFNSITQFLDGAARIRPQLLVVDDLQWADEPSLLLLEHLSERLHEMPVLILGTYRDVELDVARPLARTMETLLRRRLARRIGLRRLPEDGVAQMLATLAGDTPPAEVVRGLYEATEGNPFFVEELFRYLKDEGKLLDRSGAWRRDVRLDEVDVPEGVRLVIGRRLERLSDTTQNVLRTAAVIGRGFSYELLDVLIELPTDNLLDALDEAERAGLVVSVSEIEDRLQFAHELIRQTLLSGLSGPRLRRLHLAVADAIEELYPDDLEEHAADIASHLDRAGAAADRDRTVLYLTLAARRALNASAFEDASRLAENALALSPHEDRTRAELLYLLGLAHRSRGADDDAIAAWRQSLTLYDRLGEVEEAGRVCSDMAQELGWASKWPEALEIAARGIQLLGDSVSPERARLLGMSAILLAHSGEHDVAVELMNEAYQIAQSLNDPVLLAYGNAARALVHHAFMELEQAVEYGIGGIDALRTPEALWDYASFRGFIQFTLFFLGRWDEAERMGVEQEALARRLGHNAALLFALRSRPVHPMLTGDADGAKEFIDRDLELARTVGPLTEAQSLLWRALWDFYNGDWDAAEGRFIEASEVPSPGVWWQPQWGYLFMFHCYAGHRERALPMWAEQKPYLPPPDGLGNWGSWTIALTGIEGLWMLGEHREAAALYPLTIRFKETGCVGRGFDMRLAETLCALGAAAASDWDEAEDQFTAALTKAEQHGIEDENYDVRRFWAQMLQMRDAEGDRARAHQLLDEAIDGYKRMNRPRHEAIARALHAEPPPPASAF